MTVAQWNANFPVGTPIDWIRNDGSVMRSETDAEARELESGLYVVGVADSELPVLLTHVRVASEVKA